MIAMTVLAVVRTSSEIRVGRACATPREAAVSQTATSRPTVVVLLRSHARTGACARSAPRATARRLLAGWPRRQPPEMATTVWVRDGARVTTEGPFVQIKEALDGYFIDESDDLDASIEVGLQGLCCQHRLRAPDIRPIVES
jgi:hypothetical protein